MIAKLKTARSSQTEHGLLCYVLFLTTVEPLYSGHPWGTKFWPLYNYGWPLLRGCFVHKLFIWDLGSWPLYRGGLYSGVAVKRGSTVHKYTVTLFASCMHHSPRQSGCVVSIQLAVGRGNGGSSVAGAVVLENNYSLRAKRQLFMHHRLKELLRYKINRMPYNGTNFQNLLLSF